MLIIRKSFKLLAHPDTIDDILIKLKSYDCIIQKETVRHIRADLCGNEVVRAKIEGSINREYLEDFIKWLDESIKGFVSITL